MDENQEMRPAYFEAEYKQILTKPSKRPKYNKLAASRMTGKKLLLFADHYFEVAERGKIGLAHFCSWMGFSLKAWRSMAEGTRGRGGTIEACAIIETKIQAVLEEDRERSATLTGYILKQLERSVEQNDSSVQIVLN